MMRQVLTITTAACALLVSSFPAFADDQRPLRTAWKKADVTSEKVVRWVVEGCAAYPVTEEAPAEEVALRAPDSTEASLASRTDPLLK